MHCSRVDAFRHRADPIIRDCGYGCYALSRLTLIDRSERMAGHEGHPPWIVSDIMMRA
jgi:hypothetical protein